MMERTVPYTASEEVELYLRTYYSLLRSTSEVQVKTLEEVHSGMNSLLHTGVRNINPDLSAFIYSLLRLPDCVKNARVIVLGQSAKVFMRGGIGNVEDWQSVSAVARRRRCFYDGKEILACVIASRSDIDDIVPMLTAYQIEWNKLHRLLISIPETFFSDKKINDEGNLPQLAEFLKMSIEDLLRLKKIWGDEFVENIIQVRQKELRLNIRLLSGSLSEYRRATHSWWNNIEDHYPDLRDRPVYFVSSNIHSLVNLLSGFALSIQQDLIDYLNLSGDQGLKKEWEDIQTQSVPSSQENFLYYALKKYMQTEEGGRLKEKRNQFEIDGGIVRINSKHFFDVDSQVINLSKLNPNRMDPRLYEGDYGILAKSDALILNIDYPLGLAAYNILSEVSDHVGNVLGVYIMGKSATLNGAIGDVLIPNVVHDEHSLNTYIFSNAFEAKDVVPFLVYSSVLDNQKAVSVRGTFLQNATYMDVFYREGYTVIEMEAGPFLSAIYEMYRPKRHPSDEIVNLYKLPFDLGILHYASDTPLSKGKNLGVGTLSYFGMDPTYATTVAILRRILNYERSRLSGK